MGKKTLKLKPATYSVLVPIAGALRVQVVAASDEDAKRIGFEVAEAAVGDLDIKMKNEALKKCVELHSLEAYESVVEGNCNNLEINDTQIEEDE
jgi:hypothetical protein